jgi:hypothetical protein
MLLFDSAQHVFKYLPRPFVSLISSFNRFQSSSISFSSSLALIIPSTSLTITLSFRPRAAHSVSFLTFPTDRLPHTLTLTALMTLSRQNEYFLSADDETDGTTDDELESLFDESDEVTRVTMTQMTQIS